VSWWKDTPVLFTGAQGFVGSWVTERLLDEGARVIVLRRDSTKPSRFRLRGLDERCTSVPADLHDLDSLERVLNEHAVRAVFHLAAASAVGSATRSPLATFEVNVRGTWTLLEACRRLPDPPERIVVASTDKAYGRQPELPYREDMEMKPVFPYDVSKACADHIARSYAATYGLPVAVTRFANVFGGGDFNFTRLVPGTARSLLARESPVIRSDGKMERDFLYAADAVSAYLAVADSLADERNRGRAWNASIGEPVSVLDVVRRLIELSQTHAEPDIQGDSTPHGELERQWLDSSAINRELGWRPEWSLDRGLEATYRWYADNL
jgi:CDP-glucose 4,6-dehydratase